VRRDNARQKKAKDPIEYFKTGRVFVTAEPDEDLNGIVPRSSGRILLCSARTIRTAIRRAKRTWSQNFASEPICRNAWWKKCCPTIRGGCTLYEIDGAGSRAW